MLAIGRLRRRKRSRLLVPSPGVRDLDVQRGPCGRPAEQALRRRRVGDQVALQGNMDPSILLPTPEAVSAEAKRILASYGQGGGHVFNLGHGISQFTPPENVAVLADTVKAESRKYHG